jgi:uncharacterized membrane protein HdeD (DUF308 family)
MATGFPFFLSHLEEERQALRANWFWLLALGVIMIVVGMLAITFPVAATLTTVMVFGVLLLCGAGVEIASAIWTRRWGGFFLHFVTGLLYFFVGLLLLDRPGLGAAGYTLVLAMFFVAGGLLRLVIALSQRFSGWGWTVVSGVITLLLGILIWRDFPESALWVIGTFVGIDLLFNGWSWVMLGLAVRSLPAGKDEAKI